MGSWKDRLIEEQGRSYDKNQRGKVIKKHLIHVNNVLYVGGITGVRAACGQFLGIVPGESWRSGRLITYRTEETECRSCMKTKAFSRAQMMSVGDWMIACEENGKKEQERRDKNDHDRGSVPI